MDYCNCDHYCHRSINLGKKNREISILPYFCRYHDFGGSGYYFRVLLELHFITWLDIARRILPYQPSSLVRHGRFQFLHVRRHWHHHANHARKQYRNPPAIPKINFLCALNPGLNLYSFQQPLLLHFRKRPHRGHSNGRNAC